MDGMIPDHKFIPEVEAGIGMITEQILSEGLIELPYGMNHTTLEKLVRRIYSAGWENGYEAAATALG